MGKRFVVLWLCHLATDYHVLRQPELKKQPFVLSIASHGRLIITAANDIAQVQGINPGMVVADARAVIPSLKVFDDQPGDGEKLLKKIAGWCIRFTPFVALQPPDGIVLDATGCAHLWGGEAAYLADITKRINARGYHVRAAMAETIGTAWAVARAGNKPFIIETGNHLKTLLALPPAALRLDLQAVQRLYKLGIRKIEDFINMPRSVLRRRFGESFLQKLNQALGHEEEIIQPIEPIEPYQHRLPCLEPIATRTGIEMALQQLLESLCSRLLQEQKGIRTASFTCFRIDGVIEEISIGTHRPSRNAEHLYKLFEMKVHQIEPALGIELFLLTAQKVEDHLAFQENLWEATAGITDERILELIDRIAGRFTDQQVHRYLPAEHYWPERSFRLASSIDEKCTTDWRVEKRRPIQCLPAPEKISVTAPIPDYPPMLFRYKGKLHKIIKADGPERIEQEWWLQDGEHRDYYVVEDEEGCRYWLFRSGHYDADQSPHWFIHGFFA